MASIGEENRGPEKTDSYNDVKRALRAALEASPVPVTTLKPVVEESDYSRATVNKRLGDLVASGSYSSGVLNGTTYYWDPEVVGDGSINALAGGGLVRGYLYNAIGLIQGGDPRTVEVLLPHALKMFWPRMVTRFLWQVAHAAVLFVGISVIFPAAISTSGDTAQVFLLLVGLMALSDIILLTLRGGPDG